MRLKPVSTRTRTRIQCAVLYCVPSATAHVHGHQHVRARACARRRALHQLDGGCDGRASPRESGERGVRGGFAPPGDEKTVGRLVPEVAHLALFCYYFCSRAPPQIHSCLNTSANDGGGPNPSPKLFAPVIYCCQTDRQAARFASTEHAALSPRVDRPRGAANLSAASCASHPQQPRRLD